MAGVLLIGLGGYYSYQTGIFASTDSGQTTKTVSVAFNNFPEGDTSTQSKYSAMISKLTPQKPGYRCSQKSLKINIPVTDKDKTDQEIIRKYRDNIFSQVQTFNTVDGSGNGVMFMTAAEFKPLVDACYKAIIEENKQLSANDNCQNIARSVTKESMKDKCVGLGEN